MKRRKNNLQRDVARGKYILNPEFKESEADAKEARESFWQHPFHTHKDFENAFPEDFGLNLPPTGKWIQVKNPPNTEITVPPFSIWFAMPWPNGDMYRGRVKIVTPGGTLGLWPCEYMVVDEVTQYFGRESEGILLHQMNERPVCNREHLHYIMSRGIPRRAATLMLIADIKDPTFLWLEFAPQYGEFFGKDWPAPAACPFATPRDQWVAEEEVLTRR
jgi:hypothetical protein